MENGYELAMAVFSARITGTDEVICILKYVRVVHPLSKGAVIPSLKKQIEQKNYSDAKFQFWAKTWTADGGSPQEFKLAEKPCGCPGDLPVAVHSDKKCRAGRRAR